jgi:hypothetical protein
MADGRGDVILFGNAGLEFDAGPGFLRPLGALLIAVGPRTWLGESCDQRSNCTNVVIAAATGSSRALPGPPASIVNWPWPYQPGAVAPDGSTAAVLADGPRGATILELVSLHTGVVTPIAVPVLLQASSQTLAWSPDSQCLFVVTATGRLAVVDPRTGLTHGVSLGLSGLTQIAIRPAGG